MYLSDMSGEKQLLVGFLSALLELEGFLTFEKTGIWRSLQMLSGTLNLVGLLLVSSSLELCLKRLIQAQRIKGEGQRDTLVKDGFQRKKASW